MKQRKALALSMALLLLASGLAYLVLRGPSHAPDAPRAPAPVALESAASRPLKALSDEQLERMVAQAGEQVKKEAKDVAAWAMLAHSYEMLGKFAEAAKTYAKLAQLMPDDAQVLADYADAQAVANGRSLNGEPEQLVQRSLKIDPHNFKALTLAGAAAFERKDYAHALEFWGRARADAKDESFARQIEANIEEAKALAAGKAASSPSLTVVKATKATGPARVSGRVWLADDLLAKAGPDATVFIYARPANGSRMPVALLRKKVRDLPLNFSLDDTLAMVPDMKLSKFTEVVVGARVSERGDVTAHAGDLQALSAPLAVGTQGIKLEISEVLK